MASFSMFNVPSIAGSSMSLTLSNRWLLPTDPSKGDAR